MIDPVAIADKLKETAAGIEGVTSSRLGLDASIPSTPAAEVVIVNGELEARAAGGQGGYLEDHQFAVIFYVPLTGNGDEDEREIGRLTTAFINTVQAPDFDFTLGGLVEMTRVTSYELDVVERNNLSYRIGTVMVQAGES